MIENTSNFDEQFVFTKKIPAHFIGGTWLFFHPFQKNTRLTGCERGKTSNVFRSGKGGKQQET